MPYIATTRCTRGSILRPGPPLLSKSKSAYPALLLRDFAQRYNPPRPCFYRKPPPNAMFSYDRMYLRQLFYAPGFPLAIRERKIIPKRLCARILPSATIRRGPFLQKTALHVMYSYDQMYLRQFFTRRGFPSLSESEKSYPSASTPELCRNATIRRGPFPQKTAPHAMFSYDRMYLLSPIARHVLPLSASLSAWEARCDRICGQGDGRSPIASSILFRRDGRFAQVLRKNGVLLGTPAANE